MGPRLPVSMGTGGKPAVGAKKVEPSALSRKARRAGERQEKKGRRALHATKGKAAPAAPKPLPLPSPALAVRPAKKARPAPAEAEAPQGRAGGKGAGGARKASNFHRLIAEQGLAGRPAEARDDLDDEIDALERKLGMGKKQTAERERRALEADGLGFALNLDTKAKAKAPSTQQEGTRGRRGDAQGGLQPSKRIAAAAREKEEDDDESGEEDNDESGEEEQGDDSGEEGERDVEADLNALDPKQLREITAENGVSAKGSKELLVARILEAVGDSDPEEGEEGEDEEDDGDLTLDGAMDILEGIGGSDDGSGEESDEGGEDSGEEGEKGEDEADSQEMDEDEEAAALAVSGARGHRKAASGVAVGAEAAPAAGGKYVPPALRAQAAAATAESAETIALRRALRSGVNRVCSENVDTVAAEVLKACAGASRREVASLVAEAIFNAALSETLVLGPLVLACAALLASLHWRMGTAVGAHVAEALVLRFVQLYAERRVKPCINAALLLAHLYNLRVVHCALVYDLVRQMVAGMGTGSELEVEVLHALLRSVGGELRKDDPAALKEIVLEIGRAAAEAGGALAVAARGGPLENTELASRAVAGGEEGEASVRMQVLLQLVLDLKNNKQKARGGRDLADETIARVRRKMLGGAQGNGGNPKKRRDGAGGAAETSAEVDAKVEQATLKASWADYVNAATNGRWWLVGSAWRAADSAAAEHSEDERVRGLAGVSAEDAQLLALARKQGMNTDARRSIFVAIMGADGHIDAAERLGRLKLAKGPAREVGRVLVECCAQEALFNPYYALLGARLCESSSDFAYTLQYTYWDQFKQLSGYSVRRISNLARLLAHLLGRGALPLAALKGVEWGAMHEQLVLLLQITLLSLCAEHDVRALSGALDKLVAAKSEGALAVVEGLHLFVGRQLQKAIDMRPAGEREAIVTKVQLLRARLEAASPLIGGGA